MLKHVYEWRLIPVYEWRRIPVYDISIFIYSSLISNNPILYKQEGELHIT